MIKAIAILGFAEIISGFFALRYTKRICDRDENKLFQRNIRKFSLITGGVLAAASWPFTFLLGYSYTTGIETGRIVGIPFVVAYFDSAGRDYISAFMLPAMIGNAVFWFTIPNIIFAVFLFLHQKLKHK